MRRHLLIADRIPRLGRSAELIDHGNGIRDEDLNHFGKRPEDGAPGCVVVLQADVDPLESGEQNPGGQKYLRSSASSTRPRRRKQHAGGNRESRRRSGGRRRLPTRPRAREQFTPLVGVTEKVMPDVERADRREIEQNDVIVLLGPWSCPRALSSAEVRREQPLRAPPQPAHRRAPPCAFVCPRSRAVTILSS